MPGATRSVLGALKVPPRIPGGPDGSADRFISCGWTLARAHARLGGRVAIASYLGKSDASDNALTDLSAIYADQNERDHAALQEAVDTGRTTAQTADQEHRSTIALRGPHGVLTGPA
jgi:sugar/nucleoside kinase (ribokinase family)